MSGFDPFEQPIVRDKRRVHFDPTSGAVSHDPQARQQRMGPLRRAHPGLLLRAGLAQASTRSSWRSCAPRSPNAPPICSACRPSTPTTASGSSVTAKRCGENAVGDASSALLPVLDDIGRAREHGELEGGFRQVAEALDAAVTKLGLTTIRPAGRPFDPDQHEALMHSYSDEVSQPTAVQILQPGYSYAGRVVRPARVAVAEPTVRCRSTADLPVDDADVSPSASDPLQ